MKSERMLLKEKEMGKIESEKTKFPDLFPQITWVDDNQSLSPLGIYIPNKESFPKGFIKLYPSDFIVEEITGIGHQTSISTEEEEFKDEEGQTVFATLVKCGISTIEAVEELAQILETTKDKIQYAGIKDKDAITSQSISFRGISKEKIAKVTSPHFFLKNIHTGKGVIQKGDLKGNKFTILIRIGEDIHDQKKMVHALETLNNIRKTGFYNFFYLQRFGTPRLSNYKWAISILKADYEKAIRDILSAPGVREIPYFINKRKEISEKIPNWNEILKILKEFPLLFPTEIKIVEHLSGNPTDFLGALLKVEDQVVLWVSALASMVFNRHISSFVMAGIEPPKKLRLFLSLDKNDWLPYAEDLEQIGLFPPDFRNIRQFRNLKLQHRDLDTKDFAEIYSADITSEGIALSFTLGKGEYATTFLSHFVTLLSGFVPGEIQTNIIDIKKSLSEKDSSGVLKYFEEVNILNK